MKHALPKTLAAAGTAALLLSGCNMISGSDTTDNSSEDGGDTTPVYDEIASWNACEVLDNLQPITDYMGIVGYGSSTAEGGSPGNSELGNTFDPDAIGCNGLINLGEYEGSGGNTFGMPGEIKVKIVPANSEEEAVAAFETRVAAAESDAAANEGAATTEFGDPWDQGALVSWTGSASAPWVDVIARDGQWLFQIQLNHDQDYGLAANDEAALTFSEEELHQWFIETYLPEVHQAINDKLAEVQ